LTAGIASGLFWFALFVIAQWMTFHLRPVRDRAGCTLMLFAVGLLGQLLTVVSILQIPDVRDSLRSSHAASIVGGFLVMASLFVLYMPFYYTTAASLSVQSLIVLARAGSPIPLSRLASTFASAAVLHARLESMARNGYVAEQGDSFHITSKGRLVARLFSTLKRVWVLGPGG
jgi:hypothetical protein